MAQSIFDGGVVFWSWQVVIWDPAGIQQILNLRKNFYSPCFGVVLPLPRHFNNTSCPFCNAEDASMRHFWATCPQFRSFRQEMECSFNVAHVWWVNQPRVTAKSGWVTFDADPSPAIGAKLQAVACKLALHMTSHLQLLTDRFD